MELRRGRSGFQQRAQESLLEEMVVQGVAESEAFPKGKDRERVRRTDGSLWFGSIGGAGWSRGSGWVERQGWRAKLWPCMAYPPVRLDPMHVCYMFWGKGGT